MSALNGGYVVRNVRGHFPTHLRNVGHEQVEDDLEDLVVWADQYLQLVAFLWAVRPCH